MNDSKTPVLAGTERNVHNIVSNLKFISKIKSYHKVDTNKLTIIEDTMWNNIQRIFQRGSSRKSTFDFIKTQVTDAFEICKGLLRSHEYEYEYNMGVMVMEAIISSRCGIETLFKTYENDKMFISEIETLLSTIDTKLNTLYKIYPSLRPQPIGADPPKEDDL
jgi:hypothetical protein